MTSLITPSINQTASTITMQDVNYTFEEISSLSAFDSLVRHHKTGSAFVCQPWLQFTADIAGGKFIGLKIQDGALNTGFFAGILFRRFGVTIIGSPFRGWGTPYMGVFGNIDINQSLIAALLKILFQKYKPLYIEIINSCSQTKLVSCPDFTISEIETIALNLDKGEDQLFSRLKGNCRTYLRQFVSKGGKVVVAEPDHHFVDTFYDQLTEVFGRQGMVPTYSKERVTRLLITMKEGGIDFLCLQAQSEDEKVIASSIFFGANGIFYYWAGASYSNYQHYRPNESMIWFAIKHFIHLGYSSCDMIGVRDYKLKFSPDLVYYNKIAATRLKFLPHLRNLAERFFFIFNKLKGWRSRFGVVQKTSRLSSNLVLKAVENFERIHFQSDHLCIYSRCNVIHIVGKVNQTIALPISDFNKLLSNFRIFRRALRLDKLNVLPTATGYIIFRQGCVYHWSEEFGLQRKLLVVGCRNLMQNSIATIDELTFVFGEYGRPNPAGKNIYRTTDGGLTWKLVFNFPASQVDHVHSCKWDPFLQCIWIFTGDVDGKCKVISASMDFKDIRCYGDGSQIYRATGAFIEEKFVHWVMDSPLAEVRHVKLNKSSGEIELGQSFPGPVYYYAKTREGVYLVCTAQEPGTALKDNLVHIYASRKLKQWVDVGGFPHDGLHKSLFGFGVGTFPDGDFASDNFMMSFDAVKKYDGKVLRISLKGMIVPER